MARAYVEQGRAGDQRVADGKPDRPQPPNCVAEEEGAARHGLGGSRHLQRRESAAGAGTGERARPAPVNFADGRRNLSNLLQVCAVCGRQATEPFQWASIVFPCCSADCARTVAKLIRCAIESFVTEEIGYLAGLTFMECEAIKAARQSLYDALLKIGVADAFNDCTAEEIDSLIEAVWNGLRASMQQQSAKGEIPV